MSLHPCHLCVCISKESKGKEHREQSSAMPAGQDDVFFILFTLSVSPDSHCVSTTRGHSCLWTQPCSHTTPTCRETPFSSIFFKQLDLQNVIMVTCIVDKGTHWQPPPSVYNPLPPSLNSLSCFLMVLHSFVSASVLYLLVLPTSLFGGVPWSGSLN